MALGLLLAACASSDGIHSTARVIDPRGLCLDDGQAAGSIRSGDMWWRALGSPNDLPCLEGVAEGVANFERYFDSIAHPFEWKFKRADLNALIARMRDRWAKSQPLKLAA